MEARTEYRYRTRSVAAFLKQLRHYVEGGHYFYLRFQLGPKKDPSRTARKLIREYRIAPKPYQRTKRYRGELPSIHLLTFERDFVLISTYGVEPECDQVVDELGRVVRKQSFLRTNAKAIRNIQVQPLDFRGYSVSYPEVFPGRRKFTVRLNSHTYAATRRDLIAKATSPRYRCCQAMEDEFRRLGFEGYAPVQEKLGSILREVNKVRRRSGLSQISEACIPSKVTVTKVFVNE